MCEAATINIYILNRIEKPNFKGNLFSDGGITVSIGQKGLILENKILLLVFKVKRDEL